MKKLFSVLLTGMLVLGMAASVMAADFSVRLECEEGVITGAAKEYKDGNIQDVSIASGGKIVGLGGVNEAPQMASTVTWTVDVPVNGLYDLIFAYDSDNASEKGASMLVDGERYDVDIDISELPDKYGLETHYWTLTLELAPGAHEIAVTTSEDFNRDSAAGPVVKSVNADYVDVVLLEEVAVETEAEVVDTADTAVAAPQTFDAGVIAAVAAVVAAAGYAASRKR